MAAARRHRKALGAADLRQAVTRAVKNASLGRPLHIPAKQFPAG
jgi:hypothetical protein